MFLFFKARHSWYSNYAIGKRNSSKIKTECEKKDSTSLLFSATTNPNRRFKSPNARNRKWFSNSKYALIRYPLISMFSFSGTTTT